MAWTLTMSWSIIKSPAASLMQSYKIYVWSPQRSTWLQCPTMGATRMQSQPAQIPDKSIIMGPPATLMRIPNNRQVEYVKLAYCSMANLSACMNTCLRGLESYSCTLFIYQGRWGMHACSVWQLAVGTSEGLHMVLYDIKILLGASAGLGEKQYLQLIVVLRARQSIKLSIIFRTTI